ncbi:MAG TPA: protein kinase [Verrucomicrobiota bacterium]|nr:protein kinase [Verrucomicrobiota bacterium]
MNGSAPARCPQCGVPLTTGALAGLCPACLLKEGAAADTATHPEAKPFVPPTLEELARLFPQLEILSLLGKGGMGAVYKARQKQLDRIVALKLLPPGIGSDPAFAERFAREARALARLNHPGIVTLYEFGQVESQPSLCYFLMEFVDGVNLRQLLAGGRISSREALAIVPQICDALQYAHDQGIVHRDIKPENVLLDRRGRVKVADFGLAKIVEGRDTPPGRPGEDERTAGPAVPASLTEAGKIMGTPQYMAPEQVENPSEVDRRADIYALGVVFYQMLTGELPGQPIVPPSRACGTVQIDARLDEIVLRALERKPELRYQQASILKTQVETIASTPSTGTPAAALPRMYRGVDYRSKATLFGLPLLHVADGIDPATGKRRVAKGIIAIGGIAKGVLAIGSVAMGGFAFGGITLGVFTFGGLALGLLSTGGLAVGLIAALGGLAVAPIALGGGAVGYFAFGGAAFGVHPWSSLGRDAAAEAFFGNRAQGFMQRANLLMMLLIGVVVMVAVLVPAWLQSRLAQADSGGGGGETGPSAGGGAACSARTSSGQRNPWFAFCATLTYAGTTLFGVLCELLRSSLPGRWLILAFVLLACATGVLALLLRRFASVDTLRSAYRVSACLAFLTALPLIAFAAFFILAMLDEGFGWHPAPDEAVIVPLIWLGALSLPVCGWRLWRAARRLPNGSTASGGKPASASYWGRYAIGVLVALLLLVAIVGGAMLLANALGIIRHATSTPGLVSRWRADGDAQDSAGRNHGVLHGDAGFVAGKVGQAFSFSGRTNSFIEVPDSPTLRLTNALTIEFWVKRQDLEAEDYIINKGGDYTRGVLNYGVTINQPQWDSGLAFTFAGGFRRSTSIADLDWHHIAVVARNGDEDPTFYLDGVVQPVTARGGPLHLSLPPSVEPLRIGAQVDTASGWCFYSKAVVDELSIYDRALGPAEIEARFAAGQRGKHPPGHGLSALLRPAATRPESSATAEFHYRAFEAEAALVDRLIPSSSRRPGVQPSAKALVNFGQPVSERQVGDFKMTVKVGLTESQAAEIGAGTLRALLDGMAAKPGLLKEQRRTIGSWPLVADSWSSSLADTNFFGSSGGTGFLGARRKNGILQARMECSVSYGLDALHAQPPLGVYSRILYEGNAPTNGALVFLVPFLRHNDVPRYFVWLFEITNQTAPPRAGTTSRINHLPLEQIRAPTAFGPVIERVLPDPDNRAGKGNNETLRLRTGQLSSILDETPREGGGRPRALVASEGDLYAEYDDYVGRRWALITHGLKLSDLTPSQWENASASELNAALNIPTAVEHVEVTGATLYVLPDGLLPITFAFETRDGARGILQVTAFTDNPRGVKLRYKLAQNAPRSAELKPIPPKALELAAEWRAFARAHASVHTMTNISEQAAFNQADNAWKVQIEEQLKGTVAEPVWQQLNAQAAEWKEAIQAKDAARAWAASRQVEALGAELARMLGLPETASSRTPSPAAGFQFRWVAREGDTNSPADLLPCRQGRGPEQKLPVLREVVLCGDDVESAGFTQLGADQKELALVLTLEASGKFAEATAKNVGRQLAVVWNGRVISAPIVQAAITSRNANIAGAFTDAEARQLLDLLNHRMPSTNSAALPKPRTPGQLAEPPRLRFLAWQDQWKTNDPGAVRYADGSRVTNASELQWLRKVQPLPVALVTPQTNRGPRCLYLWFSHPLFDQHSLKDISLADPGGKHPTLSYSAAGYPADAAKGNTGWLAFSVVPQLDDPNTRRVSIQLRYTLGEWQVERDNLPANWSGTITLADGSQLDPIGQAGRDRTSLTLVYDVAKWSGRLQFGALAYTEDGREVASSSSSVGGQRDPQTGKITERLYIDLPLAELDHFRILRRPVRTMDWAEVVMPPLSPEQAAVKAIEDYGGCITWDEQGRVVKVNLVYDEDKHGVRRECTNLSDQVAAVLPALQNVEMLVLQRTQATDLAMRQVARMASLRRLYLYNATVTDRGIAELQTLGQLEYLHVSDAGLDNASLQVLSKMPHLTGLALQGNRFSDQGLSPLAKLKNLKSLWIGSGSGIITDAGLACLAPLHTLEELELQNTRVTDLGLRHLDGMTNLVNVYLGNTKVTGPGRRRLEAKHPRLKVVN